MPLQIFAQDISQHFANIQDMHKLYVYKVVDYSGQDFDTLIKKHANNYKSLKPILNTDGGNQYFTGLFYDPTLQIFAQPKSEDDTNLGLGILTNFTFLSNENLSFLQETNDFYVFTINKPWDKDVNMYILGSEGYKQTDEQDSVNRVTNNMPNIRNDLQMEMWTISLQPLDKLLNDNDSTLTLEVDDIGWLPEGTEVWNSRDITLGYDYKTFIFKISIIGDITNGRTNQVVKNIELPYVMKTGYLFPIMTYPVLISNEVNLYLGDFDKNRLSYDDVIGITNSITDANAWAEADLDGWETFKDDYPIPYSILSKWFFNIETSSGNILEDTGDARKLAGGATNIIPALVAITGWSMKNPTLFPIGKFNDLGSLTKEGFERFQANSMGSNTVYELFKLDKTNTSYWSVIKLGIALSSSILCSGLCIGGGLNELNKAILPFYLESNSITNDVPNPPTNWSNFNVLLKSNRFLIKRKLNDDKTTYTIYTFPKFNTITNDIIVDLPSTNLTLPVLDNPIQEININGNLALVDINNNNWLKYMTYIPVDTIEKFNNIWRFGITDTTNNITTTLTIENKNTQYPTESDFIKLLPRQAINYIFSNWQQFPVRKAKDYLQCPNTEENPTTHNWGYLMRQNATSCFYAGGDKNSFNTARPYENNTYYKTSVSVSYEIVNWNSIDNRGVLVFNSGEIASLRLFIDPDLVNSKYINFVITLNDSYSGEEWYITRLRSITTQNILGESCRKEIQYDYKITPEESVLERFTKKIEDETLYSNFDEKITKTETIL